MNRIKKILITVCALVMALGTSIVSSAAAPTTVSVARVKAFTVTQDGKKALKKATVYSNGADKNAKITVRYTYDDVTVKSKEGDVVKSTVAPAEVRVTSANRGIVNVDSALKNVEVKPNESKAKTTTKNGVVTTTIPVTVEGELSYTPVAKGSTKITIEENTSQKGKKKTVLNVNVVTLADGITFGGNVTEGTMTVAKSGKLSLDAKISNAASNMNLKYEVTSVTDKDGKTIDLYKDGKADSGNKKEIAKYAAVDKKGNVSLKNDTTKVTLGDFSAVVTVSSADGNATKTVTVKSATAGENKAKVSVIPDTTEKKVPVGLLGKNNAIAMKTNRGSSARTYQLNISTEKIKKSDVIFASTNPAVAKVDPATGKITAVGNGKAVINMSSKYGGKISAPKVNVTVTTDVEAVTVASDYFEILANGKAVAKIAGAVDKNASDKAVKYQILSVTAGEKVFNDRNTVSKYVSVDGKGNVKMKQACEANIDVYAAKNRDVHTNVTVKGIVPVKALVLKSGDVIDTSVKKKDSTTLFIKGAEEKDVLTVTYQAKDAVKNGNELAGKDVNVVSSSTKVAKIEKTDNGFEVIPVGNGKATITATAADGSGAKASIKVEVKTDAYEIQIAKLQKDADGKDVIYVKKDVKCDFAKDIKAATNANASNKKVEYWLVDEKKQAKNVTLKEDGERKTVKIVAADTRTHNVKDAAETPVERTIDLVCVTDEKIADNYTVEIENKEELMPLKVGESFTLSAKLAAADEDKIAVDTTALTYTTSNKSVATVANGVITAKKPGSAQITVAYYKDKKDKTAAAQATVDVFVGRKDADVQKAVNSTITSTLNAENRDYTGIKTAFNAKDNSFSLSILDPEKEFRNIKNTGLIAALKDVVNNSGLMYECVGMDGWDVLRAGSTLQVQYEGKAVHETSDINDAIDYMFENMALVSEKETLKDWNGFESEIFLTVVENVSGREIGYTFEYPVKAEMSESLYKQQIDQAISEKLTTVDIAGIETIAYNAATNSAVVTASDAQQDIMAADAGARAQVVEALQSVLGDAVEIRIGIKIPKEQMPDGKMTYYNDTVTKNRNSEVNDAEYINGIIDENLAKLTQRGKETFGDLDGSVFTADVTYEVGYKTYKQTYTMNFSMDESAFDSAADKAISEAVGSGEFAFGKVAYQADANKLTVDFNKDAASKAPADALAGNGMKDILNAMVDNTGVDKETKVVVVRDGKAVQVDVEAGSDVLLAAIAGDAKKVADLNEKNVLVKITYKSVNGASAKVLSYEIAFTAPQLEDEKETTAQEAISDNTTGEDETPVEEETPIEEDTTIDEETPEQEDPSQDETPVEEEKPADEETPAEEAPVEDVPTEETISGEDVVTENLE